MCIVTGLVIGVGSFVAYRRSLDPLHPAIVLLPTTLFMYAVWPILLNANGGIEAYFLPEDLSYAQLLYLVTLTAMWGGLLYRASAGRLLKMGAGFQFDWGLEAELRQKLWRAGLIFGAIALLAYWYMIFNAGGFIEAYSRQKGGGWAESGYVGEAVLLSFPGVVMLALARRGLQLRLLDIGLALLIASPQLLQGTFGGRRGPLFLSLALLFFAWLLQRRKAYGLIRIACALTLIGFCVIFVWSQRSFLYLGSDKPIDPKMTIEILQPEFVEPGNTYVFGVTALKVADVLDDFYWGYRYFVTIFIRPIPKQIWPTKYEDMGADWLLLQGTDLRYERYREVVGLVDISGWAVPAIVDGYLEIWWGVVPLFYLIGRFYAFVWRRHLEIGGFWTVLYLVIIMLSIYLVTQSITAWAVRLIIIAVPTFLLWKYWIQPGAGKRHRARPDPIKYQT